MECRSGSEVSWADIAEVFNLAFQDYPGPKIAWTADTVKGWGDRHFVVKDRSYVIYDSSISKDALAFGLVAVRDDKPGHVRLAAMGVTKEAQGKGFGGRALGLMIEKEKDYGTKVVELECVTSNTSAVKMYQRAGFVIMRDLYGWETDVVDPASISPETQSDVEKLEEVTVQEVDTLVRQQGAEDLTWQSAFPGLLNPSKKAFKLGHAWCAVTDPENIEDNTMKVGCVFVEPDSRGKGEGTRLVRAVMAKFAGRRWTVQAIFPKEVFEGVARRMGARKAEYTQYQMRLQL